MDNVYFLNLDIRQSLAGVEMSALARSKIFSDEIGIAPTFVTSVYNWSLHKNKVRLQRLQRASSDLKVLNMYDYFQDAVDLEHGDKRLLAEDLAPFRFVEVQGSPDVRLYNEKGEFVAYCKRHPDDRTISFINYLESGAVYRRETYDTRGFLSKVDLLEKKDDGELAHESYFRPDGTIALTKRSAIKNGVATALSIQLINREGRLERQFSSEAELLAYWLGQLVKEAGKSLFIVDRCAEFYAPLLAAIQKFRSPSRIVPVMHSVHTGGDVFAGVLNGFYKAVLEDIQAPDALVVFTEEQKQDIIRRFGNANIPVIPHSHKRVGNNPAPGKRNRFRVVYAARFAPEKNHHLALKAFRQVIDAIPQAELHLYGFGEKRQEIADQINGLGLKDKVFVKDYTPDIGAVYQEAGLSVLTSGIEAFCLGVLESLSHGCPVISFDIKYGPHSMIRNGVNGYLVPFNDVDALATKMIEVLGNQALHQKLIDNSAQSVDFLVNENVAKKWEELIDSLS